MITDRVDTAHSHIPVFSGWYKSLLFLLAIIIAIHVLIYIAFGTALISFPFDYDQAEGFELNNAILFARGDCPYCDNNIYPFFASGYAPFFHLLLVPFVWLFGPGYWYGRLIIFAATFVIAGYLSNAVYREEKHKGAALVAGGAFLSSNYIYHIGPLLRQHLLMVMFETIAVVTIANSFNKKGRARHQSLLIAFAALLLAGYTKQLAYSTVIAVSLWVFLRNPRTSIIYSSGLAILAGTIFAVAMYITDGQWWVNIISSNQNEYITEQFIGLFRQFISLHWPLIFMALLMVLYEVYIDRISVYSAWFVISIGSTVGAGKWGAGDSYFATTLAAACLLSGIFLARSIQHNWSFLTRLMHNIRFGSRYLPTILGTASLVLMLIYSSQVFKIPTSGLFFGPLTDLLGIQPKPGHRYPLYDSADWTVGYAVTGHIPTKEDEENGWRIVERVKQASGFVISEDAGFSILAGREVITNPVQLRNLWENDRLGDKGIYDPGELLMLIEEQKFGLIIRRGDFFPLPVRVAIDQYYQLDESIPMNGFEYTLWIPKT